MRTLWLLLLTLFPACGDDSIDCPAEPGTAVDIEVETNGLEVDSVVANANGFGERCEPSKRGGTAEIQTFHCTDLGGVKYRVKVSSGPYVWTKSIALGPGDECRAADRGKLRFKLDPATADEFIEVGCGDILVLPIRVKIEPHELTVDSVTSHNEGEPTLECQANFRSRTDFSCQEQGAGTYTVQVTSGDYTWSQSVELHSNGCHVDSRAELHFELAAETANANP